MDKKYNTYNKFLKDKFGVKVHKLIIDAGFSCPNRDGTISTDGCIFCDEVGSFGSTHSNLLSIKDQILEGIEILPKRFKAEKYIAYFQAFSNTYKPASELEKIYNEAFVDDRIVGISIGTRPDCIDEEKVEIISKLKFPQIELGLQSIHNDTLKLINRGHDFDCFLRAYEMIKSAGINVCVHTIFGLPNENRDMMLQTIEKLAELKIDGIKFHMLTVLRGSKLAQFADKIDAMSEEDYCNLVCDSLEILPPATTIQRLAGSGLKSELISPLWIEHKFHTTNLIDKIMLQRNSYQGLKYQAR